MQSKATTVAAYLAELPADRRVAIEAVRKMILKNLDKDFEENMSYGMIGYCVPHRVYPPGYHCNPAQPLPFAALASQKNYMSVYLMSIYAEPGEENWLRERFKKAGKKLDMGKCCVRFKKLEDLALDAIGEAIKRVPAKKHIEFYEQSLLKSNKAAARKAAKAKASAPAKKSAKKKTVKKKSAGIKR